MTGRYRWPAPAVPYGHEDEIHLPRRPRPRFELKWQKPYSSDRFDMIRLVEETCTLELCARRVYQRCTAGGLGFLRRITREVPDDLGRWDGTKPPLELRDVKPSEVVETWAGRLSDAKRAWEWVLKGWAV